MSLRRNLAVGALALVLADLSISLFVLEDGQFSGRPLPPYGAITNPRQAAWLEVARTSEAPALGIGRFDKELGWSYEPGTTSVNTLYRINSRGARSTREYGREPAPGSTRILCFGDSFTFCEEIADDATWPAMLEQRRPKLEALNFGVGGYGTDQALLRFRRLAPGLDADVITIGMLLENIGRNVNRYRPLWYPRTGTPAVKPRFKLDRGELVLVPQPFESRRALIDAVADGSILEEIGDDEYWLGRPELPIGSFSSLIRLFAGYLAYRERDPERLWEDPQGEPFQVSVALLTAFFEEASANGTRRAVVLLFPQRSDVEGFLATESRYWEGLTLALERAGIPYLDLALPLARHHAKFRQDPSVGSVFYGGHLSPVGNSMVADELLIWLEGE